MAIDCQEIKGLLIHVLSYLLNMKHIPGSSRTKRYTPKVMGAGSKFEINKILLNDNISFTISLP